MLAAAVAALALALSPPASAGARDQAATPLDPEALGQQASQFEDTIVRDSRRLRAATTRARYGGTYTANTGERVTVYLSDNYPPDDSVNQSYANFLAGLLHGSELQSLTLYIAPGYEVSALCGVDAAACYEPSSQEIVVPGEDAPDGSYTAEDVTAHEYGHHLALNRRNDPWSAFDWGPKRWASYQGVCPSVRSGAMVVADPNFYDRDPGEGFAEAYLVTNGGQWGGIVSQDLFYPDSQAMEAIRQDALNPWQGSSASSFTGRLPRRKATRTASVSTPLDGNLRVKMDPPSGKDFDLYLLNESGKRVLAKSTRSGSKAESISGTVCGEAGFVIAVRAFSGRGHFEVSISTP